MNEFYFYPPFTCCYRIWLRCLNPCLGCDHDTSFFFEWHPNTSRWYLKHLCTVEWGSWVQRILTKPLLQNRHRCTASKSSSTTQAWAIVGSSLCAEGGRKAFRLHPTHVRTQGVDKINVVTEHRAKRYFLFLVVSNQKNDQNKDTRQLCPLLQTAIVISSKGTCTPQAGQISFNWLAISNGGASSVKGSVPTRCWTRSERFLPSSDKSGGDPGRRDCTTIREMNGISLATKIKVVQIKHLRIKSESWKRELTC